MSGTSKKVVVGMSGGVDSSVAAAILLDQGFEVCGVSMNLLTCNRPIERSCCSAADREDARRVSRQLGIEHRVVDLRKRFRDTVINTFVREYTKGCTPSPCILCNEHIKFSALIEEADRSGADFVATGHYARIVEDEGVRKLFRALNRSKDQSYFLFRMNQGELKRTIFPLGVLSKKDVRDLASEKKLATMEKPESQEVCFIPGDDYALFIESESLSEISGPGDFVDISGKPIGRHRGIHAYTVGQRRGLGFGIGRRQYVVKINPMKNEVVLGTNDDLMRDEMIVSKVSWVSNVPPDNNVACVKIRSSHSGEMAILDEIGPERYLVRFDRPVRAIAPGQAAVFYAGEEVLGGGWIE